MRQRIVLNCLLGAAVLVAAAANANGSLEIADIKAQRLSSWSCEADQLILSFTAGAATRVDLLMRLKRPLSPQGKDFLSFQYRIEGGNASIAKVALGEGVHDYEYHAPGMETRWRVQSLFLREDFTPPIPASVSELRIGLDIPAAASPVIRLKGMDVFSQRELFLTRKTPVAKGEAPGPVHRAIPQAHQRWEPLGPGGGGAFPASAIASDGTLFVATDLSGVFRSEDNGKTWQSSSEGLRNGHLFALLCHPTKPGVMFAATEGGVYKSTNSGRSWRAARKGFPAMLEVPGFSCPAGVLSIDPNAPDTIYAGVSRVVPAGMKDNRVLYKSVDCGDSWQVLPLLAKNEKDGLRLLSLAVSPDDKSALYATSNEGFHVSGDGGATWRLADPALAGFKIALNRHAPDILLAARNTRQYNDGSGKSVEIMRSEDRGRSWKRVAAGKVFGHDGLHVLMAHPVEPATFILSSLHAQPIMVTRDNGDTWVPLAKDIGDGGWCGSYASAMSVAISAVAPEKILYTTVLSFYYSEDGGKTFAQRYCREMAPANEQWGPAYAGTGNYILCASQNTGIAVNPFDPKELCLGVWDKIAFKSFDGGRSVRYMDNGFPWCYARMSVVALDPQAPDVVYAAVGENYNRQRLYRSVDGGVSFIPVLFNGGGNAGQVKRIVVLPGGTPDSRTIYALSSAQGLFTSPDSGLSWKAVPVAVGKLSYSALAVGKEGKLYVACGDKLFASADAGKTWDKLLEGRGGIIWIEEDPFDASTIYCVGGSFLRTSDGGKTWEGKSCGEFADLTGLPAKCLSGSALAVDPAKRGRIYLAVSTPYYSDCSLETTLLSSDDQGRTWRLFPQVGLLTSSGISSILVDPVDTSRLYIGMSGGCYARYGTPPEQERGPSFWGFLPFLNLD